MSKPPFDWMEVRQDPERGKGERGKTERSRREAMYRTELEERAGLLQRLGHSREQARARLAANLEWDFGAAPSPLAPAALDAIVERVFGPNPGGRTVPRPKGGTR